MTIPCTLDGVHGTRLSLHALLWTASFGLLACGSGDPANPDPGPGKPPPPSECNGRAELCDRPFDTIAFPATHNAMSSFELGWAAPNQNFGMKRQLEDGIRAMLIDTHRWNDDLYLCHSICELGHTLLVDALVEMRVFLDAHPHEVVTLIIQDGITPEETEGVFEKSGLAGRTYAHEAGTAWPTLRELLLEGKQLVVGAEGERPPPAWYHHFWDIAWDTPYSFESVDDFNCAPNRGTQGNDLFLLNHWIGPLPTPERGETANAYEVLSTRAKQCQTEGGQIPNFVAVDFYDLGALFQVVDELNGF
ncbi:hypothetical protein [Polyangium mundeleinium]|uniref:Phosphatidylinositol diacylglycerol-lyase n=1 Tax=Polyangium mundeleinium TaxID=2995306 RepID=A0ABT5F0H3_9BACT|nr:hypothetical protein [Polyangium mundeleinium]MDC0747574.1 hypothetical protein [Polyangium mundeleinium]